MSDAVTGRVLRMTSVTASLWRVDSPRSPCRKTCVRNRPYCSPKEPRMLNCVCSPGAKPCSFRWAFLESSGSTKNITKTINVTTNTSRTAHSRRLTMKTSTSAQLRRSRRSAQVGLPSPAEVLPTRQLYGLATEPDCDALARNAPADDGEAEVVGGGREELVVLAEREIGDRRAGREGDALEVELEAAEGAARDVAGIHRQPVRDVGQGMRGGCEQPALAQAHRRAGVTLLAERRSCGAQRAGDDDRVAGPRAPASRDAGRAADRRHREGELRGSRGVAADHGHAGLVEAAVELEHVVEQRVLGCGEGDQQGLQLGPGGGEVAQVDGRRTEAQLTGRRPVEPEVDVLDERVLRDHETAGEPARVAVDPPREAPALELLEQAQLADLREPHR